MMHSPKRQSGNFDPRPSFMSRGQMADYLKDLRSNRPVRPQEPAGSRSYPMNPSRHSVATTVGDGASLPRLSISSSGSDKRPTGTGSSGSLSHRQSLNLSLSTRSSFDDRRSSGYFERSERQKEYTEARDVRLALEETDLEVERRITAAAKKEADELVRRHREPDAPYRVEEQSRESTTASDPQSNDQTANIPEEQKRADSSAQRLDLDALNEALPKLKKQSSYSKLANYWNGSGLASRRRSSGSRRSVSGKQKGIFVNPEDKIYEDPVERLPSRKTVTSPTQEMEPAHVRRNPFARVRTAKQSISTRSHVMPTDTKEDGKDQPPANHQSKPDGHETLPSQTPHLPVSSTVGSETWHEDEVKYKDGMEVRSADLRAATSMRFKDRSAKLPSPTAVSDRPNRPIVSFKPDWSAPKLEQDPQTATAERPAPSPQIIPKGHVPEPVKAASAPAVPTIRETKSSDIQINNGRMSPIISVPSHPAADYRVPAIPTTAPRIQVSSPPRQTRRGATPVPSNSPNRQRVPSPPSIVVEHATPPAKTPTSPDAETKKNASHRYSPFPRPQTTPMQPRPAPRSSYQNTPGSVRRTTALCAQCALPISGKVVSAAGLRFHPGCFTCYHCGEGLECVDFYAEPAEKRAGRIDRIHRRMKGEGVEEAEGRTQTDDGDDSLRFYCHLDFHEFFSPRCKSCKTPIEGEVVVACGAEWHVGHFFCAECGDPFDANTPFVEKDGYAWCIECHTNRYSAKCKKCRRAVTNTVVQALGSDWHSECFNCTICSGNFEDGRFFLLGGTQNPICLSCEEKRLKA